MHGYHQRLLIVDVATGECRSQILDESLLRRCVGGVGLGTALLHDLATQQSLQNPLHPSAPLIFAFSPLVGSPLTTSAKFAVVGQSPLTQRINDSLASSHFAIAGKKTGYDAICLVGQAAEPSVVIIDHGKVSIQPAGDLWGQFIPQAEAALKQQYGPGYRAAVIGPAGEHRVRYASISHDGRHAGRGGHGAVMGSKHIKALLVRGNQQVTFAQPEELVEFARDLSQRSLGPATAKYRELGTVANLMVFNRLGMLPTRNFQESEFAGAASIAPESLALPQSRVRSSCAACTIGCEHIFPHPDGQRQVRMEYENLYALGPLCGISDPRIVLQASALCDELGLDTISTGATLAFTMECAERGLIDTPLRFGDGESLLSAIRDISTRHGLGDLLAEGSRLVADSIGQGSQEFAPHVKGLEIPGYEPRALQMMALGFAVGTRGADHNRSGAYQIDFAADAQQRSETEAIREMIAVENEAALMDSLILCKFLRGVFDDKLSAMSEMLWLVTGWDMNAEQLGHVASQIANSRKSFNVRAGWTPAEDTLPERFFNQALKSGAQQGAVLTREGLDRQKRIYNAERGWSTNE